MVPPYKDAVVFQKRAAFSCTWLKALLLSCTYSWSSCEDHLKTSSQLTHLPFHFIFCCKAACKLRLSNILPLHHDAKTQTIYILCRLAASEFYSMKAAVEPQTMLEGDRWSASSLPILPQCFYWVVLLASGGRHNKILLALRHLVRRAYSNRLGAKGELNFVKWFELVIMYVTYNLASRLLLLGYLFPLYFPCISPYFSAQTKLSGIVTW